MKKVLVVDGKDFLTIDMDAIDVQVSSDGIETVPLGEYIETTLSSEMNYDGVEYRCAWHWENRS